MVTRKLPWKGLEAPRIIIAVTKENTRLMVPNHCDPVLKKIVTSVWHRSPEKRFILFLMSISFHLSISFFFRMTMSEIVKRLDGYLELVQKDTTDDGVTEKE